VKILYYAHMKLTGLSKPAMDWFSAKNSAGDFDTWISSFLDDDIDPSAADLRGGIINSVDQPHLLDVW